MAYLTQQRLDRFYPTVMPNCWCCAGILDDFSSVFWPCSHVREFCSVVAHFIPSLTTISIPQRVAVCLLGLVNPLAFTRAIKTLPGLFFYARKANGSRIDPYPFCVGNLYRMTCLSRGCPKKFHKVWDIWLNSPSTTVARSGPAGGDTS